MERLAKRQKLSSIETISYQRYPSATVSSSSDLIGVSTPSRTLNLADFQRPSLIFETQNYPKSPQKRRNPGRVILPRAPDVTVTTGVLEVAVNDGSTSTQIAVPTTDVAVSLSSLGTLTVPAQTTASGASSSSGSGSSGISSSGSISASNVSSGSTDLTTTARNTTTLLSSVTERTATVTATSTFHVSYINGTFIAATSTWQSGTSLTNSNGLSHITGVTSSTKGSFSFDPDQTSISDTIGIPTGGDSTAGISATATGSSLHGSSTSGSAATGGGGGGEGGGGADSGGSGGTALTPQQTQMVGGIVGGLAGVALIAFALLYVLRWYRQHLSSRSGLKRLVDFDPAHDQHVASRLVNTTGTMSSTSHSSFFPAAGALITSPKHWRTGFETVNRSGTMSPESEKGFQRIAGRKIPPVLSTGGDQYDDSHSSFHNSVFDEKVGIAISTPTRQETFHNRPNQRVLSDASVYSDYEGMYANHQHESSSEPTTPIYGGALLHHHYSSDRLRRPPLSHARSYQDIALEDLSRALTGDISRPDGFAVIRNSPARTPVTQSPITSSIVLPVQAPVSMDEDIPEMPLTSSNSAAAYGLGLGHDLLARRIPSRVSARSNSSSGRFREELA